MSGVKGKSGVYKHSSNQGFQKGKEHFLWKGDKVKYRAIHSWVYRVLGNPNKCESCKKVKLNNHNIHWANISGEYLRNKLDWIRLCVSCHLKYDYKKGRKVKGKHKTTK